MSEFHSHLRSPSDNLMYWLVRLGSIRNWADNLADNRADNWADNRADVNEKKLCLLKEEKDVNDKKSCLFFKKGGVTSFFTKVKILNGRRIMGSPYMMAI